MNPEERAAFRAFVREHHPDRGGDPAAFVAGVTRFRADAADRADPAGAPDADPGPDAPVEFVGPLPLPLRAAVALIRTVRWHRNRRVT